MNGETVLEPPPTDPDAYYPLTCEYQDIGSGFKVKLELADALEPSKVIGLNIGHVHEDGTGCDGVIIFRTDLPHDPSWIVVSPSPLTLSPSIHLPGHYHGFIENGRWKNA